MKEYPLQYASTDKNKKSHYNISTDPLSDLRRQKYNFRYRTKYKTTPTRLRVSAETDRRPMETRYC